MKHTFVTPETCSCKGNDSYCQICVGGLSLCSTCGLLEGALTTDCPGERVPSHKVDQIYSQGNLDYREAEGGWVNKPNPTNQWWKFSRLVDEARAKGAAEQDIDRMQVEWAKDLPVLKAALDAKAQK